MIQKKRWLSTKCMGVGQTLVILGLAILLLSMSPQSAHAQDVDGCALGATPGVPPGLVIAGKVLCFGVGGFDGPASYGITLTDADESASGNLSALPTFTLNFNGTVPFTAGSSAGPTFGPADINRFYIVSEQVANLPPILRGDLSAQILGPFAFGASATPQSHELDAADLTTILALQAQSSFNGVVFLQLPLAGDIFAGGSFERFAGVRFVGNFPTENAAPILAPIPTQTVNEGESLTTEITASDADGDTLTFTSDNLPTGATLTTTDVTTATLTWQTDFNDAGVYVVDITVQDSATPALTDTQSLTITVNDVNAPPVFDLAGLTLMVDEGETVTTTLTASDGDGDNLTFTSNNLPDDATLTNTDTATATLTWQTDFNDAGVYVVDITVEDEGTPPATASSSLTITVNDVNAPPVFDLAGLTLMVDEGETVTTTLTASDGDGDNLTFTSNNLPDDATLTNIDITTATLTWQTDFNDAGVYVVDIMVEDEGMPPATASSSLTITVNDVNAPPVFDLAGLTLTIDEGDVTTTTLTASDVDGDNLTFTSNNLPDDATLTNTDITTATLTWQTDFNDAGVYVVDIMVEDEGMPPATASSSLTITVNDVNTPPVFDLAGLTLTIDEGDVTTATLTASDADGDNLTFTSNNLPDDATLTNTDTATATLTWQTDFNDAGVYVVDIMVEDEGTPPATASSSLTITVNDVNAPTEITDRLAVGNIQTIYNPVPKENAPAGTFTITVDLTNTAGEALDNISFEVVELSNNNLLLNADGAPGGVGSIHTIPTAALGADGLLSPGESFTVTFVIGLTARQPFRFFVDAYGVVGGTIRSADHTAIHSPQKSTDGFAKAAIDTIMFNITLADLGSRILIPLVQR